MTNIYNSSGILLFFLLLDLVITPNIVAFNLNIFTIIINSLIIIQDYYDYTAIANIHT